MRGRASGRASSRGVGLRRGVRGQSAGTSRTHVIHKGRRGDAAHDRPGAHDGCGVRELSPIMLAAREGSSELRRRRSRRRQRAESAVVGRGRERRRRHYGQRRRHRRMCRGRHGDDPVQESSSHRSQTTSTFGRQISSQQRPHTAPKQLVLSGCGESRPPSVRWGSTWGGARARAFARAWSHENRIRYCTESVQHRIKYGPVIRVTSSRSSSSSILGQLVSQFRVGSAQSGGGPYRVGSAQSSYSQSGRRHLWAAFCAAQEKKW